MELLVCERESSCVCCSLEMDTCTPVFWYMPGLLSNIQPYGMLNFGGNRHPCNDLGGGYLLLQGQSRSLRLCCLSRVQKGSAPTRRTAAHYKNKRVRILNQTRREDSPMLRKRTVSDGSGNSSSISSGVAFKYVLQRPKGAIIT